MIKIGNNTFEVPAPAGMRSFALQQRILPVAGQIVSAIFSVLKVKPGALPGDLLTQDVESILPKVLPYIGNVFAQMPAGELEAITKELLRDATCDRLPLFGSQSGNAFDLMMQGRTIDTWSLLWHALQVWYPDFFARAAKLSGGAKKETDLTTLST